MVMREHKDCENRNDCKRAVKWSFANAVLYDQQRIEKKLTEMARKGWLIEEVKRHTGLYFDRSYLRKIETGQLATPKIVDAICEILGIAVQGDYTKRKDQ